MMLKSVFAVAGFFFALHVSANDLKKRSPPQVTPDTYEVNANKYYNSWAEKEEHPERFERAYERIKKAEKKYLMLSERNTAEIAGQAWSHYIELEDLKARVRHSEEKRIEANYKYDAYLKLAAMNFAQRRSDLEPAVQAALYEAYKKHELIGKDAQHFVKHFTDKARRNPIYLQTTIRRQIKDDPYRMKIIKQLQAIYLTELDPRFFNLMLFEKKKKDLKDQWDHGTDYDDEDAVDKNQRNYQKANLKVSAIDELSDNAARELSGIYQNSYWRHVKEIKEGIDRIHLMQAKQAKWTEVAERVGAKNLPPSPYIIANPKKPELWQVDRVGQTSNEQQHSGNEAND